MSLWERIRLLGPGSYPELLVPLCEIAVLAVAFYYLILFFRGTRGAQVLYGFVLLLIALMVLTNMFNLDALNWVLQRFSVYLAIALVVIFQPEIRRALAELGKQPVFGGAARERTLVDHVVKAVETLAERKIGALIAIERSIATRMIQETGRKLDSQVSPELLASIFFPNTPLHDGGVIISNNRIVAASCVFPLTQQAQISKALGTRHRAAIGLTEETDALVVVVSEETGTISVAYRGRLSRGLDEERLRRVLTSVLHRRSAERSRISRAREQLDLTPEGVAKTDAEAAEETEHAG